MRLLLSGLLLSMALQGQIIYKTNGTASTAIPESLPYDVVFFDSTGGEVVRLSKDGKLVLPSGSNPEKVLIQVIRIAEAEVRKATSTYQAPYQACLDGWNNSLKTWQDGLKHIRSVLVK